MKNASSPLFPKNGETDEKEKQKPKTEKSEKPEKSARVKKLPELLAPAGSPEALEAAIEAGADAVYFGAGDFNARMRAKNFTSDELKKAIRLCSEYGVSSNITLNTRLRDFELPEALSLAAELYAEGADAFITADLGLLSLMKKEIPGITLHASTQLSPHSSADAEALAELGFSRVVLPRELSFPEIKEICALSPCETEMFVHGAHCVSFSGQCMMSYVWGGRSANRGKCAQPCRLPFKMPLCGSEYPLSLKDMCLAGHIADILECGVSSLKIEGRQKSAGYVYAVTSVYRRLLDERRNADKGELEELSRIFSRDGFTDGYFTKSYGNMLGVRGDAAGEASKSFKGLSRKIPISAVLTLKIGERAVLSVSDNEKNRSAEVFSDSVVTRSLAGGAALTEEAAKKSAARLGNTAFTLESFKLDAEEDAFITLSAVNAMRREVAEKLAAAKKALPQDAALSCAAKSFRSEEELKEKAKILKKEKAHGERKLLCAEFAGLLQMPPSAAEFFDRIYLPIKDAERAIDLYSKSPYAEKFSPLLPPLTYDGEYEDIEKELEGNIEKFRGREILVNGLGQALFALRLGLVPYGSFRLNVTNSKAAKAVGRFLGGVSISPEAPTGLLSSIDGDSSVIVYGKIPIMHTQRCLISDGGKGCPFGGSGGRVYPHAKKLSRSFGGVSCDGRYCRAIMKDRTGKEFPVLGLENCTNVIYNSVPVYMADKRKFLDELPADRFHFMFTDESPRECDEIIREYQRGAPPCDLKNIRRLK